MGGIEAGMVGKVPTSTITDEITMLFEQILRIEQRLFADAGGAMPKDTAKMPSALDCQKGRIVEARTRLSFIATELEKV